MIDIKKIDLPESPGVYIFKDEAGKILYVGKSNNIKERVLSYFSKSATSDFYKTPVLVSKIADIEYIKCTDEIEATFKEASLIRDLQPQFNVQLKDSKSFPLITIVNRDDFPYIRIDRETDITFGNEKDKVEFYGPIKAGKRSLRGIIQLLQSVFKFRTCDLELYENDKNRRYFKPCILYYIKMCSAPCAMKIKKQEYLESISELRKFLNGNVKVLIEELEQKMSFYAKKLEFEKAAILRDKIKQLNTLSFRYDTIIYRTDVFKLSKLNPMKAVEALKSMLQLDKLPTVIDGLDISNIRGKYATGSIVRFVNGYPDKSGYRRYRIKTVEQINDIAMMKEVLTRRFTRLLTENGTLPDIMLLDGGIAHLEMAQKLINDLKIKVFLIALAKNRSDHIYTSTNKNPIKLDPDHNATALLTFIRDEAHRFAKMYHLVLRKKSIQ
jgi:excinuclease ABC subunit C